MSETAEAAYAALRAVDARSGGLPLDERERLLRSLGGLLVERRERFVRALDADFGGRSAEETLLAEILVVANAARHARRRLRRWARPRPVGVDLPFWPSRAWLVPQPLGVVGILSPWNYPVQLSLSPLVGALAAGNRVALKPSEVTARTADELAALIDTALGPEVARTVLGGPEVAAAFARQPFDHLLFTGSSARGRERDARRGRQSHAADARARGKVPGARVGRCRPRAGGTRRRRWQGLERRPDLRGTGHSAARGCGGSRLP